MGIRERLSGNEAVAFAMKQINPDVMGAYPITPSTEIPQYFSAYVDNGEVDTEFIPVESEHSAMSTCIGAQAAGARAISATSSCGLALMTEMMYVAASDRLPIMICQDGFITSHAIENIELVEDDKVKSFVGEYHPSHPMVGGKSPVAVGPYATPVYYMESKRLQAQAMMDAHDVILQVGKEFGEMTGRTYSLIEEYRMEDAECAIVIIGSSAGTAKEAVNELREAGKKVGLIKIRSFRPFPAKEIAQALSKVKAFAVMDKAESFNAHCGPVFAETSAALYANRCLNPIGISYIYGLGGRDVRVESIQHVFEELEEIARTKEAGETYRYLDLRQ